LAQVLAGDREPGGRMPVTIAREDSDYPALSLQPDRDGDLHYRDGVRFGYRGLAARGIAARQPFGAGFGYTTFALSDPRVRAIGNGDWELIVQLRNTGNRAGAEVVQAYRTQPELTLVGYTKAWLEPGQQQEVRITIAARRLQVWQGAWTPLQGTIDLLVGRSSAELPLAVQIKQ
jgi:beta-glucosidase